MEFWKRLSNLRTAHEMTKLDFSSSLGIPLSIYRDWEAGKLVRGESYFELSNILDKTLDHLLRDGPVETFQILEVLAETKYELRQTFGSALAG